MASLWATGELLVPLWWRGGRSCSSGWEAACHSTLGLPDGEEVLELRKEEQEHLSLPPGGGGEGAGAGKRWRSS